ncbi:MAG: signal peptidase I [Defluviitaleaceae bacterium]|nr:signal peptidase I [Defluviitaleaceae bacterium]
MSKKTGKPARRGHGRPSVEMLDKEISRLKRSATIRKVILNTVRIVIFIAAAAVLVSNMMLPVFQISGGNMDPTLKDGTYVAAVRAKVFQRGDIVVFYYNSKVLVKRVIAIGGDVVDMADDGTVTVNGIEQIEPYVAQKSLGKTDITYPYTVPPGHLFVMGDNREQSIDSRVAMIGPIGMEQVVGKAEFALWPMKAFGFIHTT